MRILRVIFVSTLSLAFFLYCSTSTLFSTGAEGLSLAQPTPSPRPRVVSTPISSPTVSATPSPTPTATPGTIQTLDDLQSRIRQRIFAPEVRRGRVGIKIVSLASGKVIFENDADKYFMPASNMKNFTVATALEKLGPDFTFATRIVGPKPNAAGVLPGDLRIVGGGDISISTAFFGTSVDDPETYYKGIDRLVEKIAEAGIKRVEGNLVGDESYFRGFAIPATWEWDDLQPYYGAEISALPLNDNAVDIKVTPGPVGSPCIVKISPTNTLFRIENVCWTSAPGSKRDLTVNKKLDQNSLWIRGSMPLDDKGFASSITVSHPADLFLVILKERLAKRGIVVTGETTTIGNPDYHRTSPPVAINDRYPADKPDLMPRLLAILQSPPFSVIAAKTMKPSQNMFTETILWTLGEQSEEAVLARHGYTFELPGSPSPIRPDSSRLGINAVKSFLKQIGVPDNGIMQYDGSGLSRRNLITPSAVVTLYTYMANQSKYAQVWRDSLTIGGIDGTLANRFRGTAAAGNIRGKTGTIDQVSALSGYVTTAGGDQLVVSFLVNGVAVTSQRTSLIDDIVVALANFNGKIDQ